MTLLNGWCGLKAAEAAYEKLESKFVPFESGPTEKTHEYLWRYTQRIHGGKHIPTYDQETGDCVSMGLAQAGNYLTAIAICEGERMEFHRWFPPFIYGVSRTAPECGNGELGRHQGSVGSWAIEGAKKYGILFEDDPDVPAYSGKLADAWGFSGPPKKYYELASDNCLRSAAKIRSVDELRNALLNRHPVIIGSEQGFEMTTMENHHIYRPKGSWGHEMCFIGWQDEPFPAAYRQNSWAMKLAIPPMNGEPEGGAWNLAEDLEREIRRGVEMFALSHFDGMVYSGRSFI